MFYSKISCGLSSGAKLDELLAQVEERLEKMESQREKMETLLVDINEKLNYLVKMEDEFGLILQVLNVYIKSY